MKYLVIALIIDLLIGDPEIIPHPVVIIGRIINRLEILIRKVIGGDSINAQNNSKKEIIGGLVLVIVIVGGTYFITLYFIDFLYIINQFLGIAFHIWLIASTIAVRGLIKVGYKINKLLKNDQLKKARREVSRVVGRDTEKMKKEDIIRAVIETLAENTSDGIIAPIFYYFLGGLPLAMTYKAINTLDSMLGYKNKKYKYFGRAAARLDDLANFVPARLTGLGFSLAALISGYNWKNSLQIMVRDARKHPSWNAGYPEAAVAGAVGIRLGGINYYHGQKSFRAYMGDEKRILITDDITKVIRLIYYNVFIYLLSLVLFQILSKYL